MLSLQELITISQRHFNRREYEQFILPIIKCLEQNNNKQGIIQLREPLNRYIQAVLNEMEQNKEILDSGEEVISLQRMKEILDQEKGLII